MRCLIKAAEADSDVWVSTKRMEDVVVISRVHQPWPNITVQIVIIMIIHFHKFEPYEHATPRTSSPAWLAICRGSVSGRPSCVFPFSVTTPSNKLRSVYICLLFLFVAWTTEWRQGSDLWALWHADRWQSTKSCFWPCWLLWYFVCPHPPVQATCSLSPKFIPPENSSLCISG